MRAALHTVQHLVLAVVFAGAPLHAIAQVSLPLASANPGSALGPGIRLEGLFYTAPVTVDGATVFRIARRTNDTASEPIQVRLQFVQAQITEVLATRENGTTIYDPKSFRVEVRSQGGQQYLVARDAHNPDLPIITVTAADAQYNYQTTAVLASIWQKQLQDALGDALRRRQPAELKRNYNLVAFVAAGLLLFTALMWLVIRALSARAGRYEDRAQKHQEAMEREGQEASIAAGAPEHRRRFLALALRASGPAEKARRLRAFSWLLGWLLLLLWFGAITWALLLFPRTAPFGVTMLQAAGRVVAIWLGVAILNRIGDIIISRVATAYGRGTASSETRARQMLRAPTISRALGGFKGFILIFVASLTTFSVIGIPVTSVITIGGVLALAVSFAAQNLVRDLLNGFLVLLEDQYVVGDYIMINDYNGIVEAFTLRIVQIRDARGNLITIPHSSAIQVVNASRNWSRVDYRVAVDPAADVAKAIGALRAAMTAVCEDEAWKSEVMEAVEFIGVEILSKNGIVLRASMRTAPLRQFELYRVLNDRVLARFTEEGIAFGSDPLPPLPLPPHASPDPT